MVDKQRRSGSESTFLVTKLLNSPASVIKVKFVELKGIQFLIAETI